MTRNVRPSVALVKYLLYAYTSRMSKIKRFRIKAGLSQPQFAAAMGVSVTAVQKWENGTRVPRTGRIRPMAQTLKCQPEALL
jgi:putative transcriptional regulator